MEEKRSENIIGSPLDADVVLHCSSELKNILNVFENELKFIFITSSVTLNKLNNKVSDTIEIDNNKISVAIKNSPNNKCDRCWHKCATVGEDKKYNNICSRCISNVYGDGEIRKNA